MSLRAQTIAGIAILILVTGIVFLMLGDAGVSTGVYLPESTLTPTPTVTPSPTPVPEGNAENWTESQPGSYTYSANPAISAVLAYQITPLTDLIQSLGLEPPAEDAPAPLLETLQALRAELETQITEAELAMPPEGIEGPVTELVGSIPVTLLRFNFLLQVGQDGQLAPGLILLGLIDRSDDQITYVQYQIQGEPDPAVERDFRAWIEANADVLLGTNEAEATEEPEAEATEEPEAEATEEPEAEATEEPEAEATEEPIAEATEEPEAEATEEPIAEATEEPEAEATEEAAEAEVTEEPEVEATEEPVAEATTPATDEKWLEMGPGQFVYASDPNTAQIIYIAENIDALAGRINTEPPADDAEAPLVDLLTSIRESVEEQVAQLGATIEDGALEGPTTTEIDGVPVVYLRFRVQPQTTEAGEALKGQELFMGLIDLGDGHVRMLQYQYAFAEEADPTVYEDFQTWLADNIQTLATISEEEIANLEGSDTDAGAE